MSRAEIMAFRRAERARLLTWRSALSREHIATVSRAICARLPTVLAHHLPATIAFYWPLDDEIDLRPLLPHLIERGCRLALPIVEQRGAPLVFGEYTPGAPLTVSSWGLSEPIDAPRVVPTVVLVPTVGFDRSRHRLGHGGGYYDRTLARLDVPTFCVAFAGAEIPTIHPLPHDVPVDFVITEGAIFAR